MAGQVLPWSKNKSLFRVCAKNWLEQWLAKSRLEKWGGVETGGGEAQKAH